MNFFGTEEFPTPVEAKEKGLFKKGWKIPMIKREQKIQVII
jgi:hypothetical protein